VLSARGLHRVLRVARTIADLELAEKQLAGGNGEPGPVGPAHLAEALQLRRPIE
jgi:predicted ATPase with chaperone activity